MLPFRGMSVGLSVTSFEYCAQTAEDIETISFAYDSPMSLSQLQNLAWPYIGQPLPPKFCPKVTQPGSC